MEQAIENCAENGWQNFDGWTNSTNKRCRYKGSCEFSRSDKSDKTKLEVDLRVPITLEESFKMITASAVVKYEFR